MLHRLCALNYRVTLNHCLEILREALLFDLLTEHELTGKFALSNVMEGTGCDASDLGMVAFGYVYEAGSPALLLDRSPTSCFIL